jgi:transcriptional regulator with XRE-family HTH domain
VTTTADDPVDRNRARQAEWYGEPLGDRLGRLRHTLGLSQAVLADILGLSAPMLSQLMSGQRAKIGNPAVFGRLVAVEAIASDPYRATWSSDELRARLESVRVQPATTSSVLRTPLAHPEHRPDPGPRPDPVAVVQALLRSVASAGEIEGAARLLDAAYPELAHLLRVYGNGRTAEARAHFAGTGVVDA